MTPTGPRRRLKTTTAAPADASPAHRIPVKTVKETR